jgi:hypothetical protein
LLAGGLWLSLALAAASRLHRASETGPILGALACAASVLLAAPAALPVGPLEVLREPPFFARAMAASAGPSEGRWRFFTKVADAVPTLLLHDVRLAREVSAAQGLQPQYDALAGIEGVAPYFSAVDLEYARVLNDHAARVFPLLGVRFALVPPGAYTKAEAEQKGFREVRWGYWLREFPPSPRAFLEGGAGEAELAAPRPELQRVRVRAAREAVLVVSTHFEAGWRATVDGAPAVAFRYQHAVIGVRVPAGEHLVELRFAPEGLAAGAWILGATLAAFAAALVLRRDGRRAVPS